MRRQAISSAIWLPEPQASQTTCTLKPSSTALIAGLLHDIGQLWLYCFRCDSMRKVCSEAISRCKGIDVIEKEHFGVDHQIIGAWLAESWTLPDSICSAIRYHHAPDEALQHELVSLLHVAEVLSNALDLTGRAENRVSSISTPAFKKLGLIWGDESRPEFGPLFGRMEARSRHVNDLMQNEISQY